MQTKGATLRKNQGMLIPFGDLNEIRELSKEGCPPRSLLLLLGSFLSLGSTLVLILGQIAECRLNCRKPFHSNILQPKSLESIVCRHNPPVTH
jgi:hypothetical protein